MSVQNINNIPGRTVNKTDGPKQVQNNENRASSPKTGKAESDKLQISGTRFENDVAFAKDVLSKLEVKNSGKLDRISNNIKNGFYEESSVRNEISAKLKKDIDRVESFIHASSDNTKPGPLNKEKIDFLTQSETVQDEISEKIIKDLSNL